MAIDTNVINIEGNTQKLVSQTNKATNALNNLDTTLVSILNHLSAVEQGMSKVNNVTNNIKKQTNYNDTTYDFGTQQKVVKGKSGFMSSNTGREKLFKDYQQAIIDETKEITADVAERKKLRKQRADTESQRARNEAARIAKKEDQSTKAYRDRQDQLAAAKYLNALANQTGKNLRDPRYQFGRTFEKLGDKFGGIGVGADKLEGKLLGGVMSTLGTLMRSPWAGVAAGVNSLVSGVVDLGKAATQAYAEIESIKTQLGVVFSNQTQADAMFGEISRYAVKSPFGVQQTSELAVLLKQSGVYASDLMDTLRMIGDTAGGNMEKMKRIANNYAQIVSIGKASMLDMRQFAYAGIPIFEAVSKELGVSQQELRKLISDGKVTSDIIEKVFKDLTGINGLFENATEKGAKTLKARLQNLQDAKQLAMGSLGERIVNVGTVSGNDSYINKLVTTVEDIYKWIQEHNDTKNIERDVETIAKREERIRTLEALVEYSKIWGNKEQTEAYKRALDAEKAKRNPDQDRTVFAQSYKDKTAAFNSIKERLNGRSLNDIEQAIQLQSGIYNTQAAKKNVGDARSADNLKDLLTAGWNVFWNSTGNDVALQAQKDLVESLIELRNAIEEYKQPTEEEIRAMKEQNVINAQQLSFDMTNKAADSTSSLNSSFNELASIYENSEEYKQKQEADHLQLLKDAQEELKKLVVNTDDIGKLNFNEIDRTEFQRLNKAGAFNATKLDIVEGNRELTSANRVQLESQFANATGKVIEELTSSAIMSTPYGKAASDAIKNGFMSLASVGSDEDFFRQFGTTLYDMQKALDELAKYNPSNKEFLTELKNYLTQSTNTYEVRTKGVNADLSAQTKGKELPDYIPLWKRIVASDTGWSAERITTAKEFMKEYQKYSAQQIARGGIQGLAMAGGRAGEIGTMLSYTGAINKQGVHQVDWEKTQQNIYDYANSLETPLKKAAGTMKGLADAMQGQVDVYRKLTADIYTVGEDWATINNDIKGQYSVAQGLGNADILDNAFEAMAKNNDKFKIAFDEEQGLVVFDKISNSIVGSIEDLKTSNEISDASLKEFLKDIKVDNLVTALDKVSKETEAQAAVIQVNSDMLQEANKLAQERATDTAKAVGGSYSIILGALKKRGVENADLLSSRSNTGANFAASTKITQAFASVFEKIATYDIGKLSEDSEIKGLTKEAKNPLTALQELQDKFKEGSGIDGFVNAVEYFIKKFPEATKRIVEEATNTATAIENNALLTAADNALTNSYFSIGGAISGNWHKGSNFEHTIMSRYGVQDYDFSKFSDDLTQSVFANPTGAGSQQILDLYKESILKNVKKSGSETDVENIQSLIDSGSWDIVQTALEDIGDGKIWQTAIEGANKLTLSLGNIGQSMSDIMDKMADMGVNFMGDAITTTFQTWGEALGKGSDASKDIAENLKSLAASTMQNMGAMITQAGLSLAVSSWGDKGGVMAGLAIAAAGGSLSFLGGYLSGVGKDDNKEDREYEKLLKIKQDLADLLKQAREDAIYYENTTRHKKAISANNEFTQMNVHDAIITPRGDVVNTDPKDYLIATKTPRSLVSGGAPTINFSVIDKSTGIKVTQQSSSYNEETNTVEFEAIIESKIQEIIASPKGDDAFSAREARLRGHSVIA